MSVYFDNRQEKMPITKVLLEKLEEVVNVALQKEGLLFPVEVSISFIDNNEMRQLNKNYRGQDSTTDVLSFPLLEKSQLQQGNFEETVMILGDIVISIPKAIEQADEYGHSRLRELAYLLVHGMFHLLGYDHNHLEEKTIMREKEELVMEELQISRTFS